MLHFPLLLYNGYYHHLACHQEDLCGFDKIGALCLGTCALAPEGDCGYFKSWGLSESVQREPSAEGLFRAEVVLTLISWYII